MIDRQYNKTGISIQVGLSGYSFKIYDADGVMPSGWMAPERLFSSPQMQRRYDEVQISVFTHKFALVPKQFYNAATAAGMLAEVVDLSSDDVVESVPVPQFASVLLYSDNTGGSLPRVIAEMVLKTDGNTLSPQPEM